MIYRVRRFEDPVSFRERAEPWLLEREAEHNLLLGVLRTLEENPDRYDPPVYLAVVERPGPDGEGGEVVGCAFRTPPHNLGLTRLPTDALPALVSDAAAVYATLPAVLGPPGEADAFARLWCERTGGTPREGMRQRIFRLGRLEPPSEPAPGRLRAAGAEDLPLVASWIEAFEREAGVAVPGARRRAEEAIAGGRTFLWEDGEPVCLVGYAGETPNGRRIGPVYTPPERRGSGYATAAVAELSRRTLAGGKRFCFLYADLANPTANRIYERLGYRPVAEAVDVLLDADGAAAQEPAAPQ